MLPHRIAFLLTGLLAVLLAACGSKETPEAQVRAVIAQGEAAAEARDLSGIMEFVSPAFQAEQAGGPEELKQYLRGYLVTHPSVHLLTRVDRIELPYRDMARVSLTLGTLGHDSASASAFDLAADVHEVELELQLEDGDWRVTRASWRPAT